MADPRYALGFRSSTGELSIDELTLEGSFPSWLSGTLLRNGPARFETGGKRMRHWFDGLSMLHAFSFRQGKVGYANRFLRSGQFLSAEKRGALRYREFATDPCRSIFSRVASLFTSSLTDNCNVNLIRLAGEYIAMTETPLALSFDPETLETIGRAAFQDKKSGQLTTAHPHQDEKAGEVITHSVHLSRKSSYRFYRTDSRTRDMSLIGSIPAGKPAYVHSIGLTERFIILAECPFTVNPLSLLSGNRPFIENYGWDGNRPSRFFVMRRTDGAVVASHEADPFFLFHHVNAFEKDGSIVCDLVAYEDASVIDDLYLDRVRKGITTPPVGELRRYVLPAEGKTRVAHRPCCPDTIELPRINESFLRSDYRYAYGVGTGRTKDFTDRIVKADIPEGRACAWHESGCYPSEPVFVPAPGGKTEDDGVVLSVVLNSRRERSFLLLLEGTTLAELARAEVPHLIPFGLHGQFFNGI